MSHRVTLIPGDGVGPEVVEATRRVVEATGVAVEWDRREIGAGAFARASAATRASSRPCAIFCLRLSIMFSIGL